MWRLLKTLHYEYFDDTAYPFIHHTTRNFPFSMFRIRIVGSLAICWILVCDLCEINSVTLFLSCPFNVRSLHIASVERCVVIGCKKINLNWTRIWATDLLNKFSLLTVFFCQIFLFWWIISFKKRVFLVKYKKPFSEVYVTDDIDNSDIDYRLDCFASLILFSLLNSAESLVVVYSYFI